MALDNLAATLGSTTVHGSLSAKNFAAPQVAFNLNADKIDTAELENITNTPSSNTAAKGKTETPSLLLSTTGGGTLAAGEIKANDIVLKNVSTKCQLDKGVISLSPLSTEIFGGKASGSLSLDERPKVAECAVKVKFAGVDANSLLSSVSSVKDMIYGSLAADTNIKFMLTQANELAHTLNGAISFNLTNGQIKNLNLMNEVEKVGKLMKGGGTETAGGATVHRDAHNCERPGHHRQFDRRDERSHHHFKGHVEPGKSGTEHACDGGVGWRRDCTTDRRWWIAGHRAFEW